MRLFGKDLVRDTVVIAEIGVNHEGNLDNAERLLTLAANAGADAVKFQTYTPSRFISSRDAERFERVSRFDLGEAGFRHLSNVAKTIGVHFFSTPVTEDVIPFLDALCPVFKVASGDLTFEPTVRGAAATGKPVILSTGLGTLDEIDQAVSWVREEIGSASLADRLVLMHCVSAYPTPVEQANVRSVPFLAERYGVPVGYSNHVEGPEACLAAVALGASVVEVHVTDRKEGRSFRDHQLSMEPDELCRLIASIGKVRASLGHFGKEPQPCEVGARAAVRKGVVAARPLEVGHALGRDDLMYARPATGFEAAALPSLLGRRLTRSVATGDTLFPKDIA